MQHFLILYYTTRRKDCHAECRKTQENHRESAKNSAYAKYTEFLCFKVLVFGDLTVRRGNIVQNTRCCGSGAVLCRTAVTIISARSATTAIIAVVAAVSGVLLVVLPYSLGIVVASVLGVLAGLCVDLAEERKQMAKTESDMPLVEALENE